MKIGSTLAAGLIGLSLAAFAPPFVANALVSDTMPPDAQISTNNRQLVAFDENAEQHEQRHEQIEHGRDRNEEFSHSDRDSGKDETRNLVRDHTPGTEEHEQHERHESEEQRSTTHRSDAVY